MESKYYVPSIEEFHVGFEYELNWKNEEWTSETVSPASDLIRIYDILNTSTPFSCRVKCLGQQDIEECGWKHSNTSETTEYYNMGEMSLYYDPTDNEVTIHEVQYNWDSCLFRGTIKNKSELKKLMKQLNITKK